MILSHLPFSSSLKSKQIYLKQTNQKAGTSALSTNADNFIMEMLIHQVIGTSGNNETRSTMTVFPVRMCLSPLDG